MKFCLPSTSPAAFSADPSLPCPGALFQARPGFSLSWCLLRFGSLLPPRGRVDSAARVPWLPNVVSPLIRCYDVSRETLPHNSRGLFISE